MDRSEAKAILLFYRPGTADEYDPEFTEARELAADDPELGRWFKELCAVQIALRSKFAQIPVPEGLKEQILAEARGHPAFEFRFTPALLAACVAGLLVVAGVWAYLGRQEPAGDPMINFRNRMAGIASPRGYPAMDLTTNDLQAINQYLTLKGQGSYMLPAPLAKATPTGCALVRWHGNQVSMICFNSGKTPVPGPDLFLFVIDRSAIADAPSPGPPQLANLTRRFATATWTAGTKTYVLGGSGDEAFVQSYL